MVEIEEGMEYLVRPYLERTEYYMDYLAKKASREVAVAGFRNNRRRLFMRHCI